MELTHSIERNQSNPDVEYMDFLKDISFQPIFIIGPHRSGTTFLHQMLDATGSFNVVRAYHLISYNQILANHLNHTEEIAKQELSDRFHQMNITDRVIDHVAPSPDLGEEYGFFFNDVLWKRQLNPTNLPRFLEFCKKIQYISDPSRPLLLKNPWDVINFIYIKRALPEAKFIFLHRHPIHAINSQLNAMRSLLAAKNPYVDMLITDGSYGRMFERPALLNVWRLMFSERLGLGLRLLTRYGKRVTNYFLRNIDSLPQSDFVSIKYEDLCTNPATTIGQALNQLGLQPRTSIAYDAYISPRPLRLLPEINRTYKSVRRQLHPYCAYLGYNA